MKMYTPPRADIPRSTFQRNHTYKTTFDAGRIYPVFLDEVLPGDTFNVKASLFARLATPIAPIMDDLFMDVFFFFVPNRLVWDNWQKFCGEQNNPGDSTDYILPSFPANTGWGEGTMADYFGLPTGTAPTDAVAITSLPFRGMHLIWNEWFRDENLQNRLVVDKDDGPDNPADYTQLPYRGRRADYFTSALPWPQKGPGVEIPIGGVTVKDANVGPLFKSQTGTVANKTLQFISGNAGVTWQNPVPGATAEAHWQDPNLTVVPGTINDLREAVQIQRLYERDARGGTRYIEILKSHFGVTSPDSRLQRPEYLGGTSIPVMINPVAQTAPTATDPETGYAKTPQGNLAGFGIVASQGVGFTKSFVEHGYVFGLVSVRANQTYQQVTNRMWLRKTREEFYWPALAHLGEQAITVQEIYTPNTGAKAVFGYQERWAEYRYHPSQVTGRFRSNATGTLDWWHLARKFDTTPVLGATFIEENPPMERVIAVPDEPDFLFDSFWNIKCARPMPMYSVPGLMDHF